MQGLSILNMELIKLKEAPEITVKKLDGVSYVKLVKIHHQYQFLIYLMQIKESFEL